MAPFTWLIFSIRTSGWKRSRDCVTNFEWPGQTVAMAMATTTTTSTQREWVDNSPKWDCKVFQFSARETLPFEWRREREWERERRRWMRHEQTHGILVLRRVLVRAKVWTKHSSAASVASVAAMVQTTHCATKKRDISMVRCVDKRVIASDGQTKWRCFNVFLCCNGSGIVVHWLRKCHCVVPGACSYNHRHHVGDSLVVLQLYIVNLCVARARRA